MKIVIDIPKKTFEEIQERSIITCGETFAQKLVKYIRNGTPLPDKHGRLIDADALQTEMEKDVRKAMSFVDLKDFVWLAPTIIEGSDSE